jgi:hypothetical protein
MDKTTCVVTCIFMVLIGFAIGGTLGHLSGMQVKERQAIKKGFAEYNQQTGEWQWKKLK